MTATVEDKLVVRMEASLAKFERQMERGRKAAEKAAVGSEQNWKRAGDRISANANKAATGLQRLSNVSGRGRFVLQNTANQIGDIAVQMGSGTSASRALGQQLPQLFGGFGALGGSLGLLAPLLGTVAALTIPLGAAFLGASGDADTMSDAMSDLKQAMSDIDRIAAIAEASVEDLTDKYGAQAQVVKELFIELVAVNQQTALNATQAAIIAAGDELAAIEDKLERFSEARRKYLELSDRQAEGSFSVLPSEIKAAEDAVAESLQALQDEFDLTSAQAYRLVEAIGDTRLAETPEQAAQAARDLAAAIASAVQEGADLDQKLVDVASSAATAYAAFAQTMTTGNSVLRNMNSAPGLEPDQFGGLSLLPPPARTDSRPRRSRGRSGGARATDGLREAQALFQSTRTEAERYAEEVERINELHRKFPDLITSEVRDRALAALEDSTGRMKGLTQSLESSFENAFTSFVTSAGSAQEAAQALLQDLAALLAQSAFKSLLGGLSGGGGFLAGLIPGFASGTNNAPGGLAVVGEEGPELVNLPRGSQVFPTAQTKDIMSNMRNSTSKSVVINMPTSIDARGAVEGTAETIRRMLVEHEPQTIRKSVAAVSQARMRGSPV